MQQAAVDYSDRLIDSCAPPMHRDRRADVQTLAFLRSSRPGSTRSRAPASLSANGGEGTGGLAQGKEDLRILNPRRTVCGTARDSQTSHVRDFLLCSG